MKVLKTTLILVCLSAVYNLNAQFQKGDWLLEAGFSARLEGSFGKTNIDLSQNGLAYFDTDGYGWNASAGKFFWENKELGITAEETWERRTGEFYQITQLQQVERVTKAYTYDFSVGFYFRRYYEFGKGWHSGWQAKTIGGRGFYAYYFGDANGEYLVEGHINYHLGVSGNLFVTKLVGKHFGGRVSFGNIAYTLSTQSYAKGVVYSKFDINLQNLITPNISIFCTFHGKRKNDRD